MWLGGEMVGCRTYDREVVGSTPRTDAINRLLLRWVTVSGQVNYFGM